MAKAQGMSEHMSGLVSLVGAGPGDPDLLTLRGKRRLEEADVVVYDRLVNPELLGFARRNTQLIDVGKSAHHHPVKQREINDMLARFAAEGKRVVRLKSGDPFVFGRGGEERAYLKAQGVSVEVVPGITSAIAGPAAAGIPVTHRDFASSLHIIAGHRKREGHELDWANIAHMEGTLVFLMGMESLGRIVENLIANGKPASTPVAVIQWATRANQRAVGGDLATIEREVEQAGLGAPALIVVGGVASLLDEEGGVPYQSAVPRNQLQPKEGVMSVTNTLDGGHDSDDVRDEEESRGEIIAPHPYPVNLRLAGEKVVVVGGGNVATRKITHLLRAGAKVTVVSPTLDDRIDREQVTWVERPYQTGDLDGAKVVLACTDDPAVNHQVTADAGDGQLVNNTANPEESDFYNVAVIDRGDLLITVSTKSVDPAKVRRVKLQLAEMLADFDL